MEAPDSWQTHESEAEEVLPDGWARLHLGHGPERESRHVRVQDPLRRRRLLSLPYPLEGTGCE